MDSKPTPIANRRTPTLVQANLVLLLSLILILAVGIATSSLHFYWTLLIREVFLILGPALLFVPLFRLSARETLRWRLPDWRVLGACVLIGIGGVLFDMWLGTLFGALLGYTLPLPPDFFPTTGAQALALFGLLAIAAPVCEEVLFRGLIQRGYEQLGVWPSIVLTGLLFVLFHQSLAQGLALIPMAILLSYLAWRTDSLPATILVHAVNNAPSALLLPLSMLLLRLSAAQETAASADLSAGLTAGLSPISVVCLFPLALVGALLVLAGLWAVRRWSPPPPPLRAAAAKAALKPGLLPWLGRFWPLFIVIPITLLAIGAEVLMGGFPELLSMGRSVQWASPPWEGVQTWRYEVRNALGQSTGEIDCTLEPQASLYSLACHRRQSAYEADTGHGVYYGGEVEESLTAVWQRSSLALQSVERQREQGAGWIAVSAMPYPTAVDVSLTTQEGERRPLRLPVPEPALPVPFLPGRYLPLAGRQPLAVIERAEWPWRFSALPFQGIYSAQAVLLDSDPLGGGDPTLSRVLVVVYGAEPIATPAGVFVAWRVEVGPNLVAWYDAESPHTLVALKDGGERWVLTSVE
jgi:membrane protease YdiL (CAAX protease family)